MFNILKKLSMEIQEQVYFLIIFVYKDELSLPSEVLHNTM